MGDLIQFSPKPNPKADRAFWKGESEAGIPVSKDEDTAPCEYNPGFVSDTGDCA